MRRYGPRSREIATAGGWRRAAVHHRLRLRLLGRPRAFLRTVGIRIDICPVPTIVHQYIGFRESYLSMAGTLWVNAQGLGHAHELRQRRGVHFFHDMAAVNLNRNFAQTDFGGDLLVHQTGDDEGHDLPLARAERVEEAAQLGVCVIFLPRPTVPLERRRNRIQHVLVAERFLQEVDRARLHGPDGHRDVAVTGDEDDRYTDIGLR